MLPVPPISLEGEPGQGPRSRPRRKAVFVLVLLGLLAALVTIALWYLLFRQPITALPLPGISAPDVPAYSAAIYGVQGPIGRGREPIGRPDLRHPVGW